MCSGQTSARALWYLIVAATILAVIITHFGAYLICPREPKFRPSIMSEDLFEFANHSLTKQYLTPCSPCKYLKIPNLSLSYLQQNIIENE